MHINQASMAICHFCIVGKSGLAEKEEEWKRGQPSIHPPTYLASLSLRAMVIRIHQQFQIAQSAFLLPLRPHSATVPWTDMPLIRSLSFFLVTGHSHHMKKRHYNL